MEDPSAHRVRVFIARYIESVELLEVLLFLQAHRDAVWRPEQVSVQFRSSPSSIRKRMGDLMERGFVAEAPGEPGAYRYLPKTRQLDDSVAQLSAYYVDHRISVIESIFSMPRERIRDFADAFKLNEEDADG